MNLWDEFHKQDNGDDESGPEFQWMVDGLDPLEQACRGLEAMVHEEGWDRRPHFYNLSIIGNLPSIELDELNASDVPLLGGLAVSEVTLPEFCYGDPASGLLNFLRITRDMYESAKTSEQRKDLVMVFNALVPAGFHGFGAVYEGWTLPHGTPEAEVRRHSENHTIDQHPDRIEMRGLTMATKDGRIATIVRRRNETPVYEELDPSTTTLMGRVPDGIRMITNFFEGFDQWRTEHLAAFQAGQQN